MDIFFPSISGKDIPDLLSSLQFVSGSVFVACACNGDLYVGDTRKPSALQQTPAGGREGAHWCMGVKTDLSSLDPSSCSVARLSTSCQVVVSDLRDLRAPLCQAQLHVQRKTTGDDFMKVTWAPALDNCLAVSGEQNVTASSCFMWLIHVLWIVQSRFLLSKCTFQLKALVIHNFSIAFVFPSRFWWNGANLRHCLLEARVDGIPASFYPPRSHDVRWSVWHFISCGHHSCLASKSTQDCPLCCCRRVCACMGLGRQSHCQLLTFKHTYSSMLIIIQLWTLPEVYMFFSLCKEYVKHYLW